ncbi:MULTISPECIES: hypothetical protein [Streptomyces]|uniref:Integral membrane protein n=1 Tax=Streptomyces chilikensis TaxID=1194079 RepID=A0ABV3EWX1_9ACTN|nr:MULTISPECIES: hypothetical protein [Streptomyces]MDH6223231.1 hypothetical protein [Streptomyces sp. MJP52]
MRTRALAVSAAAFAAIGLAAPTAGAWSDPTSISVSPSTIAPGGQLTVTVEGSACRMPGSTVTSPAFPSTPLTPVSGSSSKSTATVRVNSNATAGAQSITVRCGEGKTLTRSNAFTVLGGVRGGLGGSSLTGATPTDIAIGGGLVAAAGLGGGFFWMRRRAESRV